MKYKFLSSALALIQDSIKGMKSSPVPSVVKHSTHIFRKSFYTMILGVGTLSMAGTASATLIEAIDALDDGAMYRVLFTTSGTTTAQSSDIAFYNQFVTNAANTGSLTENLGLSWKAIASTNNMNAQTNTGVYSHDDLLVTMFNMMGQVVAVSGQDLWLGTWSAPSGIGLNESGIRGGNNVWTGTSKNGQTTSKAMGGGYTVHFGYNNSTTHYMVSDSHASSRLKHLYAMSSVGVVPTTDVPVPGTVILLSLGLAGLSFSRYRRQS